MFSGILTGCVVVVVFSTMPVGAATMDELEARIAGLEQALERVEQERKKLEKLLESASRLKLELEKVKREREQLARDRKKRERAVEVVEVIELPKRDEQATVVSLYGRFWPRVTYRDGKDTSTDITDALSRVGFKAQSKVNNNLTAFMGGNGTSTWNRTATGATPGWPTSEWNTPGTGIWPSGNSGTHTTGS
ncbi:MAG: hypothetical protein OXB94_11560 [Nitrospira sp.]|nr:hypothetical protein [Nitrospira sp.]